MAALAVLTAALFFYETENPEKFSGSLGGLFAVSWFRIAVGVAVVHQLYVWLIWRVELYTGFFTKKLGVKKAFDIYAVFFSIFFIGRLVLIFALALATEKSLSLPPFYAYAAAGVITPLVVYLMYSVKKYFSVKRAYGYDHFDKNYNEPFVKKGIFRYTDNGMYLFGLMVLYLPGLLLLSEPALAAALFHHIYIWVHYYVTEKPDMLAIYGKTPGIQ